VYLELLPIAQFAALGYAQARAITIVARTARTVSVFFAFGDGGLRPGHGPVGLVGVVQHA
jgi:hypothetical protein